MTTVVFTEGDRPVYDLLRDADLVLVRLHDGRWTVWKDRHGCSLKGVPFDDLPRRVKRQIVL